MFRITVDIDPQQIEQIIDRMPMREQIKLVEHLEKKTWPNRFKALLQRIDHKASQYPVSEKEIDQACEKIRHKHAHQRITQWFLPSHP